MKSINLEEFKKMLEEDNSSNIEEFIKKVLDKAKEVKCENEEIVMEALERSLLKSFKEDMIKKIEAIKTTEEMKEFALECAKAVLNDYERDLKNKKCDKKK